jgi:ribosomal protein RSM22 (predicted rRNA methylase)
MEEALAYLATRLPATAEAMHQALGAVARLMPSFEPSSQLDLGAGAGAAAWAARAVWPSLSDVALLDHDPEMMALGERLATAGDEQAGAECWSWRLSDITAGELPPADVVTAGYVLGELEPATALEVVDAAWRAARRLLVVVGPGTPEGFGLIRDVRDRLLSAGAAVIAPCPHEEACPIGGLDWCHFSARVERSSLHRILKGGRLGYEDEKFSYLAVVPERDRPGTEGRVLRHPALRRKLVELEVCCRDGALHTVRVGRSKATYRSARSLRWGDVVSPEIVHGDGPPGSR